MRSCGPLDFEVYQVAFAERIGDRGPCLPRLCGSHKRRSQFINVLGRDAQGRLENPRFVLAARVIRVQAILRDFGLANLPADAQPQGHRG